MEGTDIIYRNRKTGKEVAHVSAPGDEVTIYTDATRAQDIPGMRTTNDGSQISAALPSNATETWQRAQAYQLRQLYSDVNYQGLSNPTTSYAITKNVAYNFGGEVAGAKIASGFKGLISLFSKGAAEGKYINLASFRGTAHIIEGDVTGGGHAWFGSMKSFINGLTASKSMFPVSWSNSKIMNTISDVAVNNQWIQQTGKAGEVFTKSGQPVRFVVEGSYQGVQIRVITTHTDIITAFPIQ